MSTNNIPFKYKIKNKITLNYSKYNHNVCRYRFFSEALKNEFEIAVVNEPSVFETLKFYCIVVENYSLLDNSA